MAEYHDLVESLTWLLTHRLQSKSEYTRGLLGNGQGHVQVPDRDDFSYVRPDRFTTRVFEVFNKNVNGPDGMPVIVGELPWQPGLTQVLDVDWDAYYGIGWGDLTPGVARHGTTHEWRDGGPGVDAFNVYRRQMAELRTYPVGSGSTSVYVSPYNFTHMEDVKSWSGLPGLDLSGAIPGATGTARMALTYWDPCSGTSGYLGVVTGTLGVDAAPEILNRPAAPAGTIPSAWVKLRGGQGSITEFDIWDARPLWAPSIEFSTGSCGIWAGVIPIADDGGLYSGTTVEQALQQAAGTGGPPSGPAGGDLTGTYPNPTVDGLLNRPLGLDPVAEGHILMFTGSAWQPVAPTANPTAEVGLATVNGVAPIFMRFDAAPALSQAIEPTMTGKWIWQPSADATDIVHVKTNAGATVLLVDTTNVRLGVGVVPASPIHVLDANDNRMQYTVNVVGQFPGVAGMNATTGVLRLDSDLAADAAGVWYRSGSIDWFAGYEGSSTAAWVITREAAAPFFVLTSAGRLGLGGVANPAAQCDILQTDSSGAIPVLELDQDDISEGFINFVGNDAGLPFNIDHAVRVELNGVIHYLALYNNVV